MADDDMRTYRGKMRPMPSGAGSSGPRDMPDGGSTGPGNRGNPLSKADGGMSGYAAGADEDDETSPNYGGSSGSGISAVQAPNRPK